MKSFVLSVEPEGFSIVTECLSNMVDGYVYYIVVYMQNCQLVQKFTFIVNDKPVGGWSDDGVLYLMKYWKHENVVGFFVDHTIIYNL